ncbi:SprB repeat-containing protein [Candidatus Peregrinibacteria bacterium]|nr:MAG: SprB repeat-containing protein [Candidatus Peregrinibacteria bacterium]
MKTSFFAFFCAILGIFALPPITFGMTLSPETQDVFAGKKIETITISGGSGSYTFSLSSGGTGITLGPFCTSPGESCSPTIGFFEGTAILTVTDTADTSQTATSTISVHIPSDCYTDITSHTVTDWRQEYIVPGSDGYAWQRAIITKPTGIMELIEGELQKISGTAGQYSEVQVYLFEEKKSKSNTLSPPNSGICIPAGYADENGFFQTEIYSTLLWSLIGKDVVIDAYYKTPLSWEEAQRSFSGQKFFVGTNNEMTLVQVKGAGSNEEDDTCPVVCSEEKMVGVKFLDPANAPNSNILSDNFKSVPSAAVIIGRTPGIHTFYAKTEPTIGASQKDLKTIVQKTILAEGLKRFLLGNTNIGGSQKGLESISRENLIDAFLDTTGVYSEETKTMIQSIHTLLLKNTSEAEKSSAASEIFSLLFLPSDVSTSTVREIFPPVSEEALSFETASFPESEPTSTGCFLKVETLSDTNYSLRYRINWGTATSATLSPNSTSFSKKANIETGNITITPSIGTTEYTLKEEESLFECRAEVTLLNEEKWTDDLLDILAFWTGKLETNECIVMDDRSFLENFSFQGNIENNFCGFDYVTGTSPRLLLQPEVEGILTPNFQEATITFSDHSFEKGTEGWMMKKGEKDQIFYRYDFFKKSEIHFSEQLWCVSPETLSRFEEGFAEHAGLDVEEKKALRAELQQKIWGEHSFLLQLASAEDIRTHIRWMLNGKPISLFTVFFRAEEIPSCFETDFSFSFLPAKRERIGVEIGFIE